LFGVDAQVSLMETIAFLRQLRAQNQRRAELGVYRRFLLARTATAATAPMAAAATAT